MSTRYDPPWPAGYTADAGAHLFERASRFYGDGTARDVRYCAASDDRGRTNDAGSRAAATPRPERRWGQCPPADDPAPDFAALAPRRAAALADRGLGRRQRADRAALGGARHPLPGRAARGGADRPGRRAVPAEAGRRDRGRARARGP